MSNINEIGAPLRVLVSFFCYRQYTSGARNHRIKSAGTHGVPLPDDAAIYRNGAMRVRKYGIARQSWGARASRPHLGLMGGQDARAPRGSNANYRLEYTLQIEKGTKLSFS
jgi:hypothetical protein